MKKAIILFHGFKARNSDDFSELVPELQKRQSEAIIFNVSWFDSYDLETHNVQHIHQICQEIANQIQSFTHIDLIGYSTGALLCPIIKNYLNTNQQVKTFLVGPLIKRYFLMRYLMSKKIDKQAQQEITRLQKTLSPLEFTKEIKRLKNDKLTDLHYLSCFKLSEVLKMKYRKALLSMQNAFFLLATNDFAIRTPEVYRLLIKHQQPVKIIDFNHGLIMKQQKEIFLTWYHDLCNDQ